MKNRILFITLSLFLIGSFCFGQGSVGIGTESPDPSAILDLSSADKGLLLPRVDPAMIANPKEGLVIFDITDDKVKVYKNSVWKPFISDGEYWTLDGNDIYRTGRVRVGPGNALPEVKMTIYSSAADATYIPLYVVNSNDNQTGIISYSIGDNAIAVRGLVNSSTSGNTIGGHFSMNGLGGQGVHGSATNENAVAAVGVYGEVLGTLSSGVKGVASNTTNTKSFGGNFTSNSQLGVGVYGEAGSSNGVFTIGGEFISKGSQGRGIYSRVDNAASSNSYGGYFENNGIGGKGIFVYSSNTSAFNNDAGVFLTRGDNSSGINSTAAGSTGRGVEGIASDTEGTNFGGHFIASGLDGTGIYAKADHAGNGNTVGGYFETMGLLGKGIVAVSSGGAGRAVEGKTTNTGDVLNIAGDFVASSKIGRGVSGEADNSSGGLNYGGYFTAQGKLGRGVSGLAENTTGTSSYGGYFRSRGTTGAGVYGFANNTNAVINHGGDFFANGSFGRGVRGKSSGISGIGVFGSSLGQNGIGLYAESTGSNAKGVYGDAISLTGATFGGYFITESNEGTGIYARGSKHAAYFQGDVKAHAIDGGNVRIELHEGADFGFDLEYDGTEDKLFLWSKKFSGNDGIRMAWDKTGKVGIGTETPSEKLEVVGNIKTSGSVFASCGTLSCSDVRYKKEITPLTSVLASIERLEGVYYQWKEDEFPGMGFNDKRQIGVIAQELEKEFPELVHTNKNGFKTVAYDKMTPILLEGIKELNDELNTTKSDYETLKKELESQTHSLTILQEQMAQIQLNLGSSSLAEK